MSSIRHCKAMFTRGETVTVHSLLVSDLDGKTAVVRDEERGFVVAQVKGYSSYFLFKPEELEQKPPKY